MAGALGAALYATLLLERASRLLPRAYDQAFFEQVVWNLGHGGGFRSGFAEGNFLGLHFSPLLLLPAAAEVAWPDARLLSLVEALGLGASAPAGFLLLRELLPAGRPAAWLAAALSIPIPFWAEQQAAALAEFHPEVLAVPAVMLATWAGLRGRLPAMFGFGLLAIAAKEDQAYAVALAGLVVFVRGPRPRAGLVLGLSAMLWGFLTVVVVMPLIRSGGANQLSGYYTWLAHPSPAEVVAALTSRQAWMVAGGLLASCAGLPLLRPVWLLAALPPLLVDLLSSHDPQQHLGLHYGLPLVFPVVVATGLGARRVLDAGIGLPAAALAVPAIVVAILLSPLLNLLGGNPHGVPEAGGRARLMACTSRLPARAAVAADDSAATPLAARPLLRLISDAQPADWVVVDRIGYQPRYIDPARRAEVLAGLEPAGRHLVCDDGRFQLWGPVSG